MPFPPNRRLVLAGADGSLGAYSVSSASVGVSNAAGSGISTFSVVGSDRLRVAGV